MADRFTAPNIYITVLSFAHPHHILAFDMVKFLFAYCSPHFSTAHQASGVGVNDKCLEAYQALKLKKTHKYIIFTLSKDLTEIVVETSSDSTSYDDFIADLPEAECRWAVYDFEFEKEEGGKRNKLTFVSW